MMLNKVYTTFIHVYTCNINILDIILGTRNINSDKLRHSAITLTLQLSHFLVKSSIGLTHHKNQPYVLL